MPRSVSQARAIGSSSGTRATSSAMNSSRCNRDQGGGDAKQGLLPVVGTGQLSLWNGLRRAGSTPESRRKVFCFNQLGGVGSGFYQTRAPSDGSRKNCKGKKENEKVVPIPKKEPAVSNYIADALMQFMYPSEPNNQLRVLLQSLYLRAITKPLIDGLGNGLDAVNMKVTLNGLPSIAQRAFQTGSVVIPMLLGKNVASTTIQASLSDNMLIARFTTNSVDFIYKGDNTPVANYMYPAGGVGAQAGAPSMFGVAQLLSTAFGATGNKSGAAVLIHVVNTINARSVQFDSFNGSAGKALGPVNTFYKTDNERNIGATGEPDVQKTMLNPQSVMNDLKNSLNSTQLGDITTKPDFALVIGRIDDLNNYFIEEKWKEAGNNASFNGYTMNTGTQAPVNPAPYVSPSPGIGSLPLSFSIADSNMNLQQGNYPIPSRNTLLALLNP